MVRTRAFAAVLALLAATVLLAATGSFSGIDQSETPLTLPEISVYSSSFSLDYDTEGFANGIIEWSYGTHQASIVVGPDDKGVYRTRAVGAEGGFAVCGHWITKGMNFLMIDTQSGKLLASTVAR